MLVSNNLFKKSSKSRKVRCEICSNYCKIADGGYGICKQHKNVNGELFDESFGVVSSLSADPIEKKPLYHFLPGTLTYSVGGFGCNMVCLHCQNYMISQEFDKISNRINISPEVIVEKAIDQGCKSLSWTYNEPTIHLPFNRKTSLLAKRKNLKIIYVSNGYMSNQSLTEILNFVDAFNIDLKSMSQKFYKKICKADLNVVLENLKRIYDSGKHLEITNLLINDYNDSLDEINKLTNYIVDNLGCEVPLHFSRAFPYYKLNNISPTMENRLFEAKKIAHENGLEHVYIGNMDCDKNTYCPQCGEVILKRNNYSVELLNKNNKCEKCGKELNIKF
ncbi:AmmeMemoRadiSam system radical SAM enzyme [uncultured Methanobrevibacter sp.]|uniref:AmmeMemoRadiSam system radical SAM enzyme n=1 Tax=uncultured Methanobrevibacter sp. TaxID=253161 RepID=UPI00262E559B|nr:AmmeMemoRadiSam system radical SAM enzyme [uncultured Methanobrevibacter sp.]